MSRADTWMPFYVGDYLGDTRHLRTIEHGAYLLLIMAYWRNGPLPDDDRKLAVIAGLTAKEWERHGGEVRAFFVPVDGLLHQKRIDFERAKADQVSSKRREAGMAGASVRYSKCQASAAALPKQTHRQEQSQEQEQKKEGSLRSPHARATRLPPDWLPDLELSAYATERGLDVGRLTEDFRDYWHAQPGAKGVKADWDATWRRWCRQQVDRNGNRGPASLRDVGGRMGNLGLLIAAEREVA